jgi:lactoylglutathione lyase
MTSVPQGSRSASANTETRDYRLTHTMLRIKDPKASLPFYRDVLGLTLVKQADYADWKFSLYFFADQTTARSLPHDPAAISTWMFAQTGMLELTHNWGSESDENVRIHNGNDPPQGYGHICIAVPNIAAACQRFERLGVSFHKRLGEGGMRDIAFIKDPDGYRYEIVQGTFAPSLLRDRPGAASG